MRRERLSWALGWASLGIGLTELAFAEDLCRVLGVARRRSGLVRAFGVRELIAGWGLLSQPHRREWVWARVAGDALDLSLLAATFTRPRANRVWQGVITAAVAGVTLVDVFAATKRDVPQRRSSAETPSLGMDVGSAGPQESWRGSGLAEDMGSKGQGGDEPLSQEARQRMMEDAARELGLPELKEPGTHH